MELKENESPNLVVQVTQRTEYLVIRLFGSPKEPNIWLFGYSFIRLLGYSGDPNNQIFGYSVIWLFM
jgi:hypothetical protein